MIRTGRKNGHTLYHQRGDEPSDEDEFLGAIGDPEWATEIVQRFNEHDEMYRRVLALEAEARTLREVSETRRQEVQRLQAAAGPLLTPEAKADTEAAFQRGVEHARTSMGQDKYTLNRDGILKIGSASTVLLEAARSVERAQEVLAEATKLLSEDAPVKQGLPNTIGKTHVCVIPEGHVRCISANCPETVAVAPAVTPEAVAAQAPDEADDDCRCDELVGICRVHDVGRV